MLLQHLIELAYFNPFATCPGRLPPARSPILPACRIGGHHMPGAPTDLLAIAAVAADPSQAIDTASSSATTVSAVNNAIRPYQVLNAQRFSTAGLEQIASGPSRISRR